MTLTKSTESLRKTVELVEMPKTFDGLLGALRTILAKPFIHSLFLEVDKPIKVVWFKAAHDSILLEDPEESPEEVLAKVDLEEFASSVSFKELLVDASLYLNQKGLFATYMFAGSIDVLKDFVGLPKIVSLPFIENTGYHNFMGMRLVEVSSLPEGVVIILGSELLDAPLFEVQKGLKLVL
jgi:hypothetical protein